MHPRSHCSTFQLTLFFSFLAGIPAAYYFGQEGLHNILVIDMLGPSLEDLFDMCSRRFSIKTVAMLAKQMVWVTRNTVFVFRYWSDPWTHVDLTRPKCTRTQSDLSRHQTRQLFDRSSWNKTCQHYLHDRLWYGQTVSWSKNQATYSLSWAKKFIWDCTLHEYQHTSRSRYVCGHYICNLLFSNNKMNRTITTRWSRVPGSRVYVLFARCASMARSQSSYKQAKVREDWREKANDSHQGSMWWISRYIYIPSSCFRGEWVINGINPLEEFGIYLQYARKLGFEETPDYDFLRDLFDKVLEKANEADDGIYDWMMLNNGKGWEVSYIHLYLSASMYVGLTYIFS